MAHSRDDYPSTAIPEADRFEQEQQADPRVEVDEPWPATLAQNVDEADRLEQARTVSGDPDEEFSPDLG